MYKLSIIPHCLVRCTSVSLSVWKWTDCKKWTRAIFPPSTSDCARISACIKEYTMWSWKRRASLSHLVSFSISTIFHAAALDRWISSSLSPWTLPHCAWAHSHLAVFSTSPVPSSSLPPGAPSLLAPIVHHIVPPSLPLVQMVPELDPRGLETAPCPCPFRASCSFCVYACACEVVQNLTLPRTQSQNVCSWSGAYVYAFCDVDFQGRSPTFCHPQIHRL